MANLDIVRGRSTVLNLTNQSGATRSPGDLVVIDTANSDSFKTSTTSNTTVFVGVVDESIGIGSNGRVIVSGYARAIKTLGTSVKGNFLYHSTTAATAAHMAGSTPSAGAFGEVLTAGSGTASTGYIFPTIQSSSGGGSVATDTIWDTAGDIAVATGADTAAKLAIGNAGGAVSRINGTVQWNSRTSMPTAATGDRVWRTDLQGEWFYDGSQWLSSVAHEMPFPLATDPPISATTVFHRMIMPAALGGTDVYLAAVLTAFYVAGGTALSASHKWVGTVSKTNTAGSSSLGTITIDSGASDQWRPATTLTINAAAGIGSGYVALEINWVKTGTPGSLYANCSLAYRTIAT